MRVLRASRNSVLSFAVVIDTEVGCHRSRPADRYRVVHVVAHLFLQVRSVVGVEVAVLNGLVDACHCGILDSQQIHRCRSGGSEGSVVSWVLLRVTTS